MLESATTTAGTALNANRASLGTMVTYVVLVLTGYLASHHMTTEQNIIVNRIESVSMTGKEALRVGST